MNHTTRLINALFSRKWWWVTLLVLLMMGVLARLGVWQLDRLQQRRAQNVTLRAALEAAPLELSAGALPEAAEALKDRRVTATGRYDFEEQVLLKLQNWQGRAGVHLITPLVLGDGETAVLVDRGWIPDAAAQPENVRDFDVSGEVTIAGAAALTQTLSRPAAEAPAGPQREVYRVDIATLEQQMPYRLLPVYILQAPPPEGNVELPFRSEPEFDLSEGSHLSYAVQWFIFSLGLGIGYLVYVNRSLTQKAQPTGHVREA